MMHRRQEQSRIEGTRADFQPQKIEIEAPKKTKLSAAIGVETLQSHGDIRNVFFVYEGAC